MVVLNSWWFRILGGFEIELSKQTRLDGGKQLRSSVHEINNTSIYSKYLYVIVIETCPRFTRPPSAPSHGGPTGNLLRETLPNIAPVVG